MMYRKGQLEQGSSLMKHRSRKQNIKKNRISNIESQSDLENRILKKNEY